MVVSATLVAVMNTIAAFEIVDGAVYRPLVTVPVLGERVHVTAVLVVPLTAAENWAVPPALRLTTGGVSET